MSSFLPTRIFLMYQIIEGEVDCIDKCHHLGSVPIKCKVMVVLTQHFFTFCFCSNKQKSDKKSTNTKLIFWSILFNIVEFCSQLYITVYSSKFSFIFIEFHSQLYNVS